LKFNDFIDGLEAVLVGVVWGVAAAFRVEGFLADLSLGALGESLKILEVFWVLAFWSEGGMLGTCDLYLASGGKLLLFYFLH
jgi:hypothetical protein